jgi:glutathione synthase/RimK-type ligase-like ATP-grasp enzyme
MTTPTKASDAPIAVLYENGEWMEGLFAAMTERGLAYEPLDLADGALLLGEPGDHPLVINRVSPSADTRGNGSAIGLARGWLAQLERHGTRVINGANAFRLETSKVAQDQLIRHLGLRAPRTAVFNNRQAIRDIAGRFPFPAILKPDTGGSGSGVRFVNDRMHLERLLDDEQELFGPDGLLLLQEYIASPDGSIVRMEFVDGDLLFAIRVRPENTFNLCPADGCERPPIDGVGDADAHFEHDSHVSTEAVAQARAIVRAADLDVGGVEYIESADGERYFYDINATSVYRPDIVAASGVDAMDRLVSFIERESAGAQHEPALQAA